MKRDLVIFGANELGLEVKKLIDSNAFTYSIIGFIDQHLIPGSYFFGLPVLGDLDDLMKMENISVVLAVPCPRRRQFKIGKLLRKSSFEFPNIISPNAWLSNKNLCIGVGNVVLCGSNINYGAVIKNFILIGRDCYIEQEAMLGDFCTVGNQCNIKAYSCIKECDFIKEYSNIPLSEKL